MKKTTFRLISFLLIAVMACGSLAGCGKKVKGIPMDKEHVYKAEYFDMPEGLNNVYRFKVKNDRIFVDGYMQDAQNNYLYKIYSMNADGTDAIDVLGNYKMENSNVNNYAVDNDGNIYLIENTYIYDDSDPENIISKNSFNLVKLDGTGKELVRKELSVGEEFYPSDILCDGNNNLMCITYNGIFMFDAQGNDIGKIDTTTGNVDSAFFTQDGRLLVTAYNEDYTKREIKELLVNEKKLGDPIEVPGNGYAYTFSQGVGCDLFMKDTTNLYGFNLATKEQTQIMNFIDSDINGSMVSSLVGLSDGKLVCFTSDYMKGTSQLMRLTKVPPEEVVEKQILTLAALYMDYQMSSNVIEFNKKNDKYRITIKDYSQYNTMEDYMAGSNKLNTDIVSGDIPDILCVNDYNTFSSSANKGLFADLYKLMDKDPDFNKDNYLANILSAQERDGKLFALIPYFSVQTIVGKTSLVGNGPGWNMDEYEALLKSKPDSAAFRDMTQESFMYYATTLCMNQFVDTKMGSCNFGSDFIRVLEMAKEYPTQEELYGGGDGPIAYSTSVSSKAIARPEYDENAFRNESVLLNNLYLSTFNDIHTSQLVDFGEDVTFIGFPCESRNGSAISPIVQLAISSRSVSQEAAWSFVKTLLGDDFQNTLDYYWPTKLSSLEKKKEKDQKPDTYVDENGKEQVYENTYFINGKEVKVGKVTDEECEKVMNFLRSLNQVSQYDQKINDIITEESGAFFSDQKSADETAKIIQNRVQTYLNEIQ